jgi:hypothetical protein
MSTLLEPGSISPSETSDGSSGKQGTPCPKCGYLYERAGRTWCPKCGFVEQLGTYVDLDEWERVAEDEAAAQGAPVDGPWWRMIPGWVWIAGAGVIGVAGISGAAVGLTGAGSAARGTWCGLQILLGVAAFAAGHIVSFYLASMETDNLSPTDVFLRPLAVWGNTIRTLPGSAWRIWAASWGITAVFFAFTVVGGIDYDRFWDWGFKQPAQQDLLAAVIEQAKNKAKKDAAGNEDLNDALNKLKTDDEEDKAAKEPPLKSMDCLIIGYTTIPDDETKLDRLVLASLIDGKLTYVGSISAESIPTDSLEKIQPRFAGLEQSTAIVAAPYQARWLAPKLLCRVKYRKLDQKNRLEGAKFDDLLADL